MRRLSRGLPFMQVLRCVPGWTQHAVVKVAYAGRTVVSDSPSGQVLKAKGGRRKRTPWDRRIHESTKVNDVEAAGGPLLNAGIRFNEALVLDGLRKAAVKLTQSFHVQDDKTLFPIVSVVGVAGQGKTGVLRLLRRNHPILLADDARSKLGLPPNASRQNVGWLDFLLQTFNAALDGKRSYGSRKYPKIRSAKAVMATFDQVSNWDATESRAQCALSARLIADYSRCLFVSGYKNVKLANAIDAIRMEEAKLKNLRLEEVLIVVLVDEIRCIPRQGSDRSSLECWGKCSSMNSKWGTPSSQS
jgi:hypothetical protein